MLRNAFASHYMMARGSRLALWKIFGHGNMTMTMICAHLTPDYPDREMEPVKV